MSAKKFEKIFEKGLTMCNPYAIMFMCSRETKQHRAR